MFSRPAICTFSLAFACAVSLRADPGDTEFFEKKIRPLLDQRCSECHSAEKKVKGGLRLDSRERSIGRKRCCNSKRNSWLRSRSESPGDLYAVLETCRPRSSIIRSRITNFCALPVTVIGISSTNRT